MMSRSLVLLLTVVLLTHTNNYRDSILARASVPAEIAISQVYGAGGNSGAVFRNDFIELINRGGSPVNLSGWSVQYTSAAGASWSKTDLNGTIAPGSYFLVQLASGGANGALLPTPDAVGAIAMAAAAGKVALTNSTTALTGGCPATTSIVDLVGYGLSATCFEGPGPAPAPSSTLSARRAGNGCQDTDQNSNDFATSAAAPRNSSSPANLCSNGGGARFSRDDVRVVLSDSGPCTTVTVEVRLKNTGNRAQRDNPGSEFFSNLPPGLKIVPGSCQAGSGACTVPSLARIDWDGGVAPGETVVISWQMRLEIESTKPGDQLCLTATVNYDANDDATNEGTTSVSTCLAVTCQAGTPGIAMPINSEQSADRTGSVLVFPFYTSSASSPATDNAIFSLTSVHVSRPVAVHLFFVADESPSVVDMFVCLTANQTRSFLASEVDPGSAGYLIAVAVDGQTGCPISFNNLFGEASVKLESGHAATLVAEAFGVLGNEPALCSQGSLTAELRFDGKALNLAPRVLAIDSVPSPEEGSVCLLILDRLGGSLLSGVSTLGQISGLLFGDDEMGFSFSINTSRRQLRIRLDDSFPRTTPRFGAIIPAGRTGWSKIWLGTEGALVGAILVANSQVRIGVAAHAGGRNLHKLRWTDATRLTMPVFPPSC